MIFYFIFSPQSYSQDERYFRKVLKNKKKQERNYPSKNLNLSLFQVSSPGHLYDLNGDGRYEILETTKSNGLDILRIYDNVYQLKFELPLIGLAINSSIKTVRRLKITPNQGLLIISFYEGSLTKSTKKSSSTRLYFVLFDIKTMNSFKTFKGPIVYYEEEHFPKRYHFKNYQVYVNHFSQGYSPYILIKNGSLSYIYQIKNNKIVSVR